MSETVDKSRYVIPNEVPVCLLKCSKAFNALEVKEKNYCHYLSKACEQGGLIVLLQTSPESVPVFLLLQRLFSLESAEDLQKKALENGVTEDEYKDLLAFAAGFYCNMGNYKSFGDTKIVPGIPKESFEKIIKVSKAYKENTEWLDKLWKINSDAIYDLGKRRRELGIGEKGLSTYYSSNITKEDIKLVQGFMKEQNISPYNTRLFKDDQGKFQLRLASIAKAEKYSDTDDIYSFLGKTHTYQDKQIEIIRGDYSALFQRSVAFLEQAKTYAANDTEVQMIENYIKSFTYGSINSHKEGSKYWVKDKGPIVETYLGFIESYRDPYGVRGEYEGFVSVVDKEMSAKFGALVEQAEELLAFLPWPEEYEKDKFLRPDFTSLDVVTFAGSGIPAGINIPNYDDIRQDFGFKNVSLGNVLSSNPSGVKVTFLSKSDEELYTKYKGPSFEVQVGLHELLGHGSGKLFKQKEDGSFNFDKEKVLHLETKEKISTWYNHGETWDTKFGPLASSYEECRAECVGILLCLNNAVLKIFGHVGDGAEDIIYVNWLNMVRAGLLGLEFYSPETKSWKQAHMNARYVILRVLMEADSTMVTIENVTGEDGQPDLLVKLDREKIKTTGREAIANFLMRLQLYKATADVKSGQAMYQKYSNVDERMLKERATVLKRKQPRRLFIQCNTKHTEDNDVTVTEYETTCSGLIQSNIERYLQYDTELEELSNAERQFHQY